MNYGAAPQRGPASGGVVTGFRTSPVVELVRSHGESGTTALA